MATSLSTYGPPSNTIPTAHPSPQPKRHPYRFSRLRTDDRRVSLYFTMGRPYSPKNLPLPMGGSGLPSNTWFPGPTQVLNPKGSSIGAAVFAGLTSVTDRSTDHATWSVRIGCIYVRSTAMRPKIDSVGIFVAEKWVFSVVSVERHSKWVIIVKSVLGERLVNISSLHAPHSGKPDEEKESLSNNVFIKVGCVPQDEMVVVAGDMNGHVGNSNYWHHCMQRKVPVFKLLRGQFWGFSSCRGDTLHR